MADPPAQKSGKKFHYRLSERWPWLFRRPARFRAAGWCDATYGPKRQGCRKFR